VRLGGITARGWCWTIYVFALGVCVGAYVLGRMWGVLP
jgi:hypothetical protein